MCDYSLQHVKSRAANVADKLTTKNFGTGTVGFCASEDAAVAVCVIPGTEIAFDAPIVTVQHPWENLTEKTHEYSVGIFRQVDKEIALRHHDALELPNGEIVLLNSLAQGQVATVLQLPAAPKSEAEEKEQQRLEIVA